MTTPRKLTLDEVMSLPMMGNVALAPDGRHVAFEMHATDIKRNEESSCIMLLSLDEEGNVLGKHRQLTSGVKNDSNPVWAPDSRRLLFVSNRDEEKNQLWLIDTQGGEARRLTNMAHGVAEAAWSPDGKWLAFTAMAAPDDDDEVLTGRKTLDEAAKKQQEEKERFAPHHIKKIWYRVDGRGIFEKCSQVFIMPAPVEDEVPDPATIRRLTSGDYDHERPQWTPDSQEIGVLCNRSEQRDRSFVMDLWAIDRESGEARCLTESTLEIECFSWSPSGHAAIVVGGKDEIAYGRSLPRLHLVTRKGNEGDHTLLLMPDFDKEMTLSAGGQFAGSCQPVWSHDGQHVYFLVTERGCVDVYRMDVVWRSMERLTHSDAVTGFLALFPGEQGLLLALNHVDHPHELYRLPLADESNKEPVRLTHLHDRFMDEIQWGKTEHLRYKGANGDEVDGWLTYPVGAREGVHYPLLVRIHGGPHWAFSGELLPLNHYFAAQGYAVFYCNPHGSTGCGEAFMRQVLGDWGGYAFQDIMLGVDECIARGVADPERMVVAGYSYGGYMTMRIIGQTDRFKAAMPMAGISNLASFVGTSDIGFWMVAQAQGYPWDPERADYYRQHSPLTHAAHVTTPTLFLHPENDLRCPIEQTEQFFMTLKMMGKVPVEFVRVPAAWHGGTTKPAQGKQFWEIMLEWFGKHIEIRPEEYQ